MQFIIAIGILGKHVAAIGVRSEQLGRLAVGLDIFNLAYVYLRKIVFIEKSF